MRPAPAAAALLLLLPGRCGAAGGVSIFKLGAQIDDKHWDILWMYFATFGLTMILETIVHQVHVKVTTSTGQEIAHHVVQEVMILGAISALLVIFENLGGGELIDAPLFHYVHFVIFVMMVIFICLVTCLFATVQSSWDAWECFEERVMEIESDPALRNEERVAFLLAWTRSVPNGQRKLACLCFFRQNLPSRFIDVPFTRYMKKMQRKILLSFLHLTPRAWFMLGLLCALAAGADMIVINISTNPVATIALWVLIVGFGPLIVLVVLAAKVRSEFRHFAASVQQMRQDGLTKPGKQQREYFWRGQPAFSVAMVQTLLLYQVFYLATALVNFTSRLWAYGKENYGRYAGALFIASCYLPSIFVFFVMIPQILPLFTILSAQGDFLNHECILGIVQQDQHSGKFRRRRRRDRETLTVAEGTSMDANALLLRFRSQFGGGGRKAAGVLGAMAEEQQEEPEGDQDHLRDDVVSTHFCWETSLEDGVEKPCGSVATVKCHACGFLCGHHDTEYHRLRLCKDHDRVMLDASGDENSVSGSFSGPSSPRPGGGADYEDGEWVPPWLRDGGSPARLRDSTQLLQLPFEVHPLQPAGAPPAAPGSAPAAADPPAAPPPPWPEEAEHAEEPPPPAPAPRPPPAVPPADPQRQLLTAAADRLAARSAAALTAARTQSAGAAAAPRPAAQRRSARQRFSTQCRLSVRTASSDRIRGVPAAAPLPTVRATPVEQLPHRRQHPLETPLRDVGGDWPPPDPGNAWPAPPAEAPRVPAVGGAVSMAPQLPP